MGTGTDLQSAHPLLEPRTLGSVLNEVATSAAPRALLELIRWLESFTPSSPVGTQELARVVMALHDVARPQIRQAGGLYLSNAFGARSTRYKTLAQDFYASLGQAYDLVMARLATDAQVQADDPLRLEVMLRVVQAAVGETKWRAFDYQEPARRVWERAVEAYRQADAINWLNVPVALRNAWVPRSSVHREFAHLVALLCASLEHQPPERIEAIDKLICELHGSLQLVSQPLGNNCYSIDLTARSLPQRALRLLDEVPPGMRFFRPGDALTKLAELARGAADGSSNHAFAGLGVSAVLGATRHLMRQWGSQSPMRQYRRHEVSGAVALATGLGFIRTLISGDAQLRPAAAWELLDASRSGFGVRSGMFDADICRVGALVGVHVGETDRWVLALVRRVRCQERGASVVGLQTLSNVPVPALFEDDKRCWNGILCDPLVRGREVRVACEPGFMRSGTGVSVSIDGRTIRLMPGKVILSGPGYHVLHCQVL
ncbi:MAG: hypothetical protein ACRCTU_07200 [Zoogloea sp.]|uniref:hypothetical protein n=1 Tax=Zoogloea sp. TaxID=49181 RepID=UPI003F40A8F6